jgi:hypothetical protein
LVIFLVHDPSAARCGSAAEIAKRYENAIVKIEVIGTKPGRHVREKFDGSGFIVGFDNSGPRETSLIVTSANLIGSSNKTGENPDWQVRDGKLERKISVYFRDQNDNAIKVEALYQTSDEERGWAVLMIERGLRACVPLLKNSENSPEFLNVVVLGFKDDRTDMRQINGQIKYLEVTGATLIMDDNNIPKTFGGGVVFDTNSERAIAIYLGRRLQTSPTNGELLDFVSRAEVHCPGGIKNTSNCYKGGGWYLTRSERNLISTQPRICEYIKDYEDLYREEVRDAFDLFAGPYDRSKGRVLRQLLIGKGIEDLGLREISDSSKIGVSELASTIIHLFLWSEDCPISTKQAINACLNP